MDAVEQPPQAVPEGEADLSSRTILVLVLLTLAVSFISAWVSISTADSIASLTPQEYAADSPAPTARVSLTVAEQNREQSTGMVALAVVPAAG